MLSTAISRIVGAAMLVISSIAAAGPKSNMPPQFLTVPVLGLRLPLERIDLEPFPEDLRVKCSQLEDEFVTSRVWIFGSARMGGKAYYVLTGYFKRLNKEPDQKLYEFWENGAVYTVTSSKCGGDDAEETFDVHDTNADKTGNVPTPILRVLATDLAAKTVKAFGGADQLRAEIKKQRIDFNRLSPELQEAFAPYFATSATAAAHRGNRPPEFLTVPMLGLRVALAGLKLDQLPASLSKSCGQIYDPESYTAYMRVFGKAKDSKATYYVVAGYNKWRNPVPGQHLYDVPASPIVLVMRGDRCSGDDAEDTFANSGENIEDDDSVPGPILRALAHDLADKTVQAVGGPDRLRAEIKNQRIDFNWLPSQLREAFAPYFTK
jgi:hypothetical protein